MLCKTSAGLSIGPGPACAMRRMSTTGLPRRLRPDSCVIVDRFARTRNGFTGSFPSRHRRTRDAPPAPRHDRCSMGHAHRLARSHHRRLCAFRRAPRRRAEGRRQTLTSLTTGARPSPRLSAMLAPNRKPRPRPTYSRRGSRCLEANLALPYGWQRNVYCVTSILAPLHGARLGHVRGLEGRAERVNVRTLAVAMPRPASVASAARDTTARRPPAVVRAHLP